jgi:23S rRNA pseudouridine1911/1915/1917 synthase
VTDQLIEFHYREERAGRLDKFLVSKMPDFSRTRLQGLIKDGFVLVDQVQAHKGGKILEPGAVVLVRVPPPVPSGITPEAITLDVVFENDDLLVINKPAGMAVHPSTGHTSGTLVNAALAHAPQVEGVGGELRPGIVHRLDKNTSGLIIVAKNDLTHRALQDQFRLRKVIKLYLALVDGRPPTPRGRIEAPIGRDASQRKKMAIVSLEKGREAVSEYHTLEAYHHHTFLEIHPITGRTHQIRLHLSFIGCPIVGDTIYGFRRPSLPINRHFLHAARITVILPGESQPRTFEANLPQELSEILEGLRLSSR